MQHVVIYSPDGFDAMQEAVRVARDHIGDPTAVVTRISPAMLRTSLGLRKVMEQRPKALIVQGVMAADMASVKTFGWSPGLECLLVCTTGDGTVRRHASNNRRFIFKDLTQS